jgi:phage terminase large subunit-like protein
MKLKISLHPAQRRIWNSPKRFWFVRAGRRFGKTDLAANKICVEALTLNAKEQEAFDETAEPPSGIVMYVAPTFQQAKDLMWKPLRSRLEPLGAKFWENTGRIECPNGRVIMLKGSDNEDSLRGNKIKYVVVDEYKDMKPDVFEVILRPALADLEGGALIIGTPNGKDHFYRLGQRASKSKNWECFHFTTYDNPFIPVTEIEEAKSEISKYFFRQEFLAEYAVTESDLFKKEDLKVDNQEPKEGEFIVTVDLAGFTDFSNQIKRANPNLDNTAICSTKTHGPNWWVKTIDAGRWTVAETAKRIVAAAKSSGAKVIGIEKGVLFQAIFSRLETEMQTQNHYARVVDLTHGNKEKTQRILWALQGKIEHGKIRFNQGAYFDSFVDELMNFPNPSTHDDMIDSLALVDQIANDQAWVFSAGDFSTNWVSNIDTDDF